MFDGDWSSFYMSAVNGEQLIFDLGKAQQLHSFLFLYLAMMITLYIWETYMNYFIMRVVKVGFHWAYR